MNKIGDINLINNETNENLDDAEMPEVMNKYFANIGKELVKKIKKPEIAVTNHPTENRETSELRTVTVNEVKEKIKELSYYKSSGFRELSSMLLIDAMTIIPAVFTHIFNMSIITGIFPDDWKVETLKMQ